MKLSSVTAIINNFMRPEYTRKCVESLRANYPDVKIIVGNSDKPDESLETFVLENGGRYIELPFDCGITVARNLMMNEVKTKYVLVGDDDFFYDKNAHLEILLKLMNVADVAGGRVYEHGILRSYQGDVENDNGVLRSTPLDMNNYDNYDGADYKKCDIVFNFFIANRYIISQIPWDEKIKVAYEHSDWFISLKGKAVVVFSPDAIVIHKPKLDNPINEDYENYRSRRGDKDYFFKKHKIHATFDFAGRIDGV